jgi:DNA repair exonuclease SbcCD nuclease subunit
VYHFSYDRTALLALYHLFLELISQGKTVYVLAGNHDRLGSSFVFEEAKKAFDIVNTIDHAQGKIFFITQAQFVQIEGQEVLFLPYTIQVGQLGAIETKLLPMHIQGTIELLKQSKNKNEQLSAYVNEYLRSAIADKQDLLIIHHYYIIHTKFPGQKSLFSYKDVALHEAILQQPNIKSIS